MAYDKCHYRTRVTSSYVWTTRLPWHIPTNSAAPAPPAWTPWQWTYGASAFGTPYSCRRYMFYSVATRRRSVLSAYARERMEFAIEDVSPAGPPVGSSPPRLIYNARECQNSYSFCVMELPPPSVVDQCLFSELNHFIRSVICSLPHGI